MSSSLWLSEALDKIEEEQNEAVSDINPSSNKPKSREIIIEMTSQQGGVTMSELLQVTKMKPHSLRAWKSRFNKKQKEEGNPDRIEIDRNDKGERIYIMRTAAENK